MHIPEYNRYILLHTYYSGQVLSKQTSHYKSKNQPIYPELNSLIK